MRTASSLLSVLCAGLLMAGAVHAADPADDDDDLFQDTPAAGGSVPNSSSFKDDEDIDIPMAKPPPEERNLNMQTLSQTTKMPLNLDDKVPLADNWPPQIVYTDKDAVVVEIPVLYARSRAEFDGIAYWLVAEVYADGKKVAESRMLVNRDAIAEKGPSIQFFRMFAPVSGTTGTLEIKVGKAASGAAKPTELFAKTLPFKL